MEEKTADNIRCLSFLLVIILIFAVVMYICDLDMKQKEKGLVVEKVVAVGKLVSIKSLDDWFNDECIVTTTKRVIKVTETWTGSFNKELEIRILKNGDRLLCEGDECISIVK